MTRRMTKTKSRKQKNQEESKDKRGKRRLEGGAMNEVSSSVPRVELPAAFKVSNDELKNTDNDDDTVPFS